jgi:DNA-binding MarR family transcriptional regulator
VGAALRSPRIHLEVLTKAQRRVLTASRELAQSWGAYLAGGVAAGLQLGHRRSEDFDWFTPNTVQPGSLLEQLHGLKLAVEVTQNQEGTFLGFVGGVKFSLFRYRYPLVARPISVKGIQIAALEDIAAMKLVAVVQRAEKRDYVDIHALLADGRLSLADMLRALLRKAPQLDPEVARQALAYFADAERTKMPEMLNDTTWEKVKSDLARAIERISSRRI